jgi:ATP-dependent RNA helicase DeaD
MTSDPTEDTTTFADLGLRPELLGALSGLGYEEPTPIQREAIPPLLQGRDLLGQAATGTGKTAAFALPVLERIGRQAERGEPMALVLVPTRELAVQVSEAMHRYGRELGARILPIYGGQPIGRQLRALERGVDVVVATPGRAIDHITRQTLGLGSLQVVVLDEADEMLDMGFAEDIEAILRHTPQDRQTVLFSATMPPRINAMVRRHLRDPVRIQLGGAASGPGAGSLVRQRAYVVPGAHKAATSVATSRSATPLRSRPMTRSRWAWSMPPCSASARWPRPFKVSVSSSTWSRVRQKTSAAVGASTSSTRPSAAALWARGTT